MAYGSVKIDSIITSTKTVAVDNLSVNGNIDNASIAIDAAIAFSKLQNVSAADKILGRGSSGAGAIEEITCTVAGRALLDDVDASAQRTTLGLGSLATASNVSNTEVATDAAIAGTKISPDFGSQNVVTTGTSTAASFIPTSSTVPINGVYLPAANSVALSTNGTRRLLFDSTGGATLDGVYAASAIANRGRVVLQRAEGSYDSPTAVTTSSDVGSIIGRGYGDTIYRNTGEIKFSSDGAISDTVSTGYISFSTTPAASTSPQERLRITSDGKLGLGSSTPGSYSYNDLVIAGATGGMSIVTGTTGTGRLVFADGVAGVGAYRGAIQYDHANDRLELAADGSPRVYLTSTGLAVGTTSPQQVLHVVGTSQFTSTNTVYINPNFNSEGIAFQNASNVPTIFTINNSERARIDTSGRLLVGTSTSIATVAGIENLLQVAANADGKSGIQVGNYANSSGHPSLIFDKSRSGTVGTKTIVQANDGLGILIFNGTDGSNFIPGAFIQAQVDGTPGANDMPGRLVFSTTANGASSPTERVRVTSTGRVGINQVSPATTLDLSGAYAGNVAVVGALDIDCASGNYFTKTINANSTFTFSNVPASRAYGFTLELTHTSGTVTWPATVKWPEDTAPTLTTGKTHLFVFVTDNGGARWRGAALVNYVN